MKLKVFTLGMFVFLTLSISSCVQNDKQGVTDNSQLETGLTDQIELLEGEEIAVDDSLSEVHSTPKYVTRGASGDRYRTYVKTKFKCKKCWSTGTVGCTGYWGYKHGNGTYEGRCRNSDGHGHTCGHSPEEHGLRSW